MTKGAPRRINTKKIQTGRIIIFVHDYVDMKRQYMEDIPPIVILRKCEQGGEKQNAGEERSFMNVCAIKT